MVVCILLAALSQKLEAAGKLSKIHPYEASYQLTYKGSVQSTPQATLEVVDNNHYRYTLDADGSRGLARLLRASTLEISEFLWNHGQPQPLIFRHHLKHIGKSDRWDAIFDWEANTVKVHNNDKSLELELKPETNDPFTFLLSMQHAVANGKTQMTLLIVDKDKIEHKSYRVSGAENLSTALGCLPTIKVERVYPKKRNKFQYNWLAPEFDYMVVRNESGRDGKLRAALEIRQLNFNGNVVNKMDRCNN